MVLYLVQRTCARLPSRTTQPSPVPKQNFAAIRQAQRAAAAFVIGSGSSAGVQREWWSWARKQVFVAVLCSERSCMHRWGGDFRAGLVRSLGSEEK